MRAVVEGGEAGITVSVRATRLFRDRRCQFPSTSDDRSCANFQPDDHAQRHLGEGSAEDIERVRRMVARASGLRWTGVSPAKIQGRDAQWQAGHLPHYI